MPRKKAKIVNPVYENNEYFRRFYGFGYDTALEKAQSVLKSRGLDESVWDKIGGKDWQVVERINKTKNFPVESEEEFVNMILNSK